MHLNESDYLSIFGAAPDNCRTIVWQPVGLLFWGLAISLMVLAAIGFWYMGDSSAFRNRGPLQRLAATWSCRVCSVLMLGTALFLGAALQRNVLNALIDRSTMLAAMGFIIMIGLTVALVLLRARSVRFLAWIQLANIALLSLVICLVVARWGSLGLDHADNFPVWTHHDLLLPSVRDNICPG